MHLRYPVDIEEHREGPPPDHGYLVTFPDLPEAIGSGEDLNQALVNAAECLDVALAGRIRDREAIPTPSPPEGRRCLVPGQLIAAKAALYLALREQGVSQSELARRLSIPAAMVHRLLDPRHRSRADQLDAAAAALGKRLVVSIEDAA